MGFQEVEKRFDADIRYSQTILVLTFTVVVYAATTLVNYVVAGYIDMLPIFSVPGVYFGWFLFKYRNDVQQKEFLVALIPTTLFCYLALLPTIDVLF